MGVDSSKRKILQTIQNSGFSLIIFDKQTNPKIQYNIKVSDEEETSKNEKKIKTMILILI